MGELGRELLKMYDDARYRYVNIINMLIMFSTTTTGLLEIFKALHLTTHTTPMPLFFGVFELDLFLSIFFAIVGLLVPFFYKKGRVKAYKTALSIVLIKWVYLFMFFVTMLSMGNINFTWILIANIILQILYILRNE